MAIPKPQAQVIQEFSIIPAEITAPLRSHISGGNALLHRYSKAAEKATIGVGEYDRLNETCYPWPGRQAGGLVDRGYARVFADNALLLYLEDMIGDATEGRGLVAPVAGRVNWIRSNSLSFKTNGAYSRSSILNDRDVAIGDTVYIRGIADPTGACDEVELWTSVAGFASDTVDAVLETATEDSGNQLSADESATITKIAGAVNCITWAVDGSAYDGLASGDVTEIYTIEVIKSSIAGCNAARLRVTSASGRDDADEVAVTLGEATDIGSRGLTVTWSDSAGSSCSATAYDEGVSADELVVGQKWRVNVSMAFEKVCAEAGGDYTGTADDVYVVEVTKGGLWASLPQISVTTVKGLDFSGPTDVSNDYTAVPIGTQGVTISFTDCSAVGYESLDPLDPGDDSSVPGLRKGDKFYVTVTAASAGPVRTLILKDDVPDNLEGVTDLDLRLFIKRNIEITENRVSSPPDLNWTTEATQLCLNAGATAYDSTWTHAGTALPLAVWGGSLYIQYREWVTDLINTVATAISTGDLDDIPGPIDIDNPLKYGVFWALRNSGSSGAVGAGVRYTAVADPDDVDSWVAVLHRLEGRKDVYMPVPMTDDPIVQGLFQAFVEDESVPEVGAYKGTFLSIKAKTEKMLVGLSTAAAQLLSPTSTDNDVVLATLGDNPQATGTQYTRLRVPAGNAGFVTYGVAAGDIVRFLFTVDGFGTVSYSEFVVDEVLSENTLILLAGTAAAITQPQKMEVWHRLTKDEVVTDLKEQAGAFGSTRVCAVWPDYIGTAGITQPGYFLCAGLAGLASSVVPQQGLTNVQVSGADDYSRSTTFFRESQLQALNDGGVWIVTTNADGTAYTRHALTTDVSDLNHQEEMIRRNVDSISFYFQSVLAPFIGRTNVTPSMLGKLQYTIEQTVKYLCTNAGTAEIGPQLISGTIRSLAVHPLLADRVEIVLDLVIPAPMNNITIHLVV